MLLYAFLMTGAFFDASVFAYDLQEWPDMTAQELKLREKGVEAVEKQMTVLVNPVYQARVDSIINRLAPFMERRLPYEIKVVDHKSINAFALAGGAMYVTTAMLDFVKTDLELAGVLAHEMAHADKKHVMLQMARNERMTLLALAAIIATKGQGAAIFAANAVSVAVMGSYSVEIEKEADALGIDVLTSAGYNPVGMLTLQERLLLESMKRAQYDPGIFQTHPDTDERIAAAVAYMGKKKIPVNRKYSLGLLKPTVDDSDGSVTLRIDGAAVWRGGTDEKTRGLFNEVAMRIDRNLQLETTPYEITTMDIGEGAALYIGGKKVVGAEELLYDTQSIEELRSGIMDAISKAVKENPLADYYL